MSSGEKDAARTAEVLLLALDQIDDLEKAPILATVFAAFLRGRLSRDQFRRMIAAVNSALVDDLRAIAEIGPDLTGNAAELEDALTALKHTGLTGDGGEMLVARHAEVADMVTPLGRLFISILSAPEASEEASRG